MQEHLEKKENVIDITSCRVCYEPIKAGALKCIKCSSYQDWTRHLLRWSALLVSVFALAPLWSISDSLSRLTFVKKEAQIQAALTDCSRDEFRLVFENWGNTSGIITGVTFSLLQDGKRTEVPGLNIRELSNQKDIVVSPNQLPIMVSYQSYIDDTKGSFISEPLTQQSCFYLLEIDWIDLVSSKKQLKLECKCP